MSGWAPASADAQHRPPGTARDAFHQRPLPGPFVQPVALEPADRLEADVHRDLRAGTGNPRCAGRSKTRSRCRNTSPPTATGPRPPARFFTTVRSRRRTGPASFRFGAVGPACRCRPQKFVHTPDDTPRDGLGRVSGLRTRIRRIGKSPTRRSRSWRRHRQTGRSSSPSASACRTSRASRRRNGLTSTPSKTLLMPAVKEDDRDDVPAFSWFLHWKLPEPRLSWLKGPTNGGPWSGPIWRARASWIARSAGCSMPSTRPDGPMRRWSSSGPTMAGTWAKRGSPARIRSGSVPLACRWSSPALAFPPARRARARRSCSTCTRRLIELCGLTPRHGLDGHSLVPQLKDANAPRPWPAITTHNRGSHSVRSERWRYIRYADGTEELYDHRDDPHEWKNLANDPRLHGGQA